MKSPSSLRCYAEGRSGQWMAICLDLDISVDGDSFLVAVKNLEMAIDQYYDYVTTLPEQEQQQLLQRKAPLSLRIKFFWFAFRALWNRHDGDNDPKGRAEFVLPAGHCHA